MDIPPVANCLHLNKLAHYFFKKTCFWNLLGGAGGGRRHGGSNVDVGGVCDTGAGGSARKHRHCVPLVMAPPRPCTPSGRALT